MKKKIHLAVIIFDRVTKAPFYREIRSVQFNNSFKINKKKI
jgi:hypothetical protein